MDEGGNINEIQCTFEKEEKHVGIRGVLEFKVATVSLRLPLAKGTTDDGFRCNQPRRDLV